ncbi:hypothetical protein THAOC_00230, partial [Thalassiosira oceanica]
MRAGHVQTLNLSQTVLVLFMLMLTQNMLRRRRLSAGPAGTADSCRQPGQQGGTQEQEGGGTAADASRKAVGSDVLTERIMASKSSSPDENAAPPWPSSPNYVSAAAQGPRGRTNVDGSTAAPLARDTSQQGVTASTVRAFNGDDPSIPVWHAVDKGTETEGPQLHDGPSGPPCFPNEFDDSLLKRGENDSEGPQLHDGPPGPLLFPHEFDDSLAKRVETVSRRDFHDSASMVRLSMGASVANSATMVPSMIEDVEEGGGLTFRATSSPVSRHTEAGAATAAVELNSPSNGCSTFIAEAYRVEGGTVYEAELAEPQAAEPQTPEAILPFYQRKGFVSVMIAVTLLAIGITVATGVLLSNNLDGNNGEAVPALSMEAPTTIEVPTTEAAVATGVPFSNNLDGNNGEAAPSLMTEAPITEVPATEATVAVGALFSSNLDGNNGEAAPTLT